MTLVLVGTWEAIKEHDAELMGKTVRLIVETDDQEPEILDGSPEPPNTFHSVEQLEAMLLEGLNSGPAVPYATMDEVREKGRALAAERYGMKRSDAANH